MGKRCEGCLGRLAYDKKERYWKCIYCDNIYERELRFDRIQIDGMAGINDLSRAAMTKTMQLDFAGAERELAECDRLEHRSVATRVAHFVYALFKSLYAKDERTRAQDIATAERMLQRLLSEYPAVTDPEEILYDYLESDDLYGLLVAVFGRVGQGERVEILMERLDCDQVRNPYVSRALLRTMLTQNHLSEAGALLQNIHKQNVDAALRMVLDTYPAGEDKVKWVKHLLAVDDSDDDLPRIFDNYFAQTSDPQNVTIDIFLDAMSHKIELDATAMVSRVMGNCNDPHEAQKVFAALSSRRLGDDAANTILQWCLYQVGSLDICEMGLRCLFDSNSIFELQEDVFVGLLSSNVTDSEQIARCQLLLNVFKVQNRTIDKVIAYHLTKNKGEFDYRKAVFELLVSYTGTVQMSTAEAYIMGDTPDADKKPEMVDLLLKKQKITTLYSGMFSTYLQTDIDNPAVREGVILQFLKRDLTPDNQAYSAYLLNKKEKHSPVLLQEFQRLKCKPMADTFEQYLRGLTSPQAYDADMATIMTDYTFIISESSVVRYCLYITEVGAAKCRRMVKFMDACRGDLKGTVCHTTIKGETYEGNLAQIYLLSSPDDKNVSQEILKIFSKHKIKADAPIRRVSDRKNIKMKKLIASCADTLKPHLRELAEEIC